MAEEVTMSEVKSTSSGGDVPMAEPSAPSTDAFMQEAEPASDSKSQSGDVTRRMAAEQVEFYFADSNLPYDKFMWTLHTSNPEHWVPLSTVASFKRMREFQVHGMEWLIDALRAFSEDLEVDAEGKNIRRKTGVREPEGQFERSIYAKGFGEETPELQRDLEKFFQPYGKTNAVRMRRNNETKEFKGSVFVEFADMKSVNSLLNADPKPTWNGAELLIMSKEAYCEMKIKEKGLTGKAKINRKSSNTGPKSFNAFAEMKRNAQSKSNGGETRKAEIWLEFLGTKLRVHEDDGGSIKPEDVPYVKGSALKFSGCGGDISWSEIKDPLKEHFSRAPFIKFQKGDDSGLVGFDKTLTDEDIAFVKEKVKTIQNRPIEWTSVNEEEEKSFIIERANAAAQKVFSTSQSGGRGGKPGRGRGGRGGRGGSRGSRGGRTGPSSRLGTQTEVAGEKRKRAVEPDGGIGVGERGHAIPTIVQSAKKVKTDAESTSTS